MKVFLFLLTLIGALPLAASDVDRVMAEAFKPSPIADNLRRLTDEIGGRVPGTPEMESALVWAEEALRAAGADSIHREEFRMPTSWSEGLTHMEITSPVPGDEKRSEHGLKFAPRVVSMAWSPAVRGLHVRVVDVGFGSPEEFARAGDVHQAILLLHTDLLKTWDDLFNEYLKAPPILERAVAGKALALLFISSREHDVLYRHINSLDGSISPIASLLIAREDGERIARLLHSGRQVFADFSAPNRVGESITTANVVGELKGGEHAEEFVVLGAHLDSWDLGTGALDNGCNAALVIDTLRAIKATGVQPRRSIRFILFSGEEQGMFGSYAYVRKHRDELDRAVAVVVFDEGVGRVTGYSLGGRRDLEPALQELLAPLAAYKATEFSFDAPVGTDNWDFLLEGVPNLIANQEEANYMVNYHAASDTFDKVDIPELKKHVAIAAATVLAIADAPQRLGPRQSRAQVEELLHETHADDQMKTFGLWPAWESGTRGRAK